MNHYAECRTNITNIRKPRKSANPPGRLRRNLGMDRYAKWPTNITDPTKPGKSADSPGMITKKSRKLVYSYFFIGTYILTGLWIPSFWRVHWFLYSTGPLIPIFRSVHWYLYFGGALEPYILTIDTYILTFWAISRTPAYWPVFLGILNKPVTCRFIT